MRNYRKNKIVIAGFCSSDAVRFRLSSHIHTERSKLGILQYSGQNLEHRKVQYVQIGDPN